MSISTPELLVPFGDDDLLTTTTHVPFLGLGATAAAAVPYYSGTGGGGFAREHGVDAGEQFGAAPSSMKKAEQEQVMKPPNCLHLGTTSTFLSLSSGP
jgi:hypothetical protein